MKQKQKQKNNSWFEYRLAEANARVELNNFLEMARNSLNDLNKAIENNNTQKIIKHSKTFGIASKGLDFWFNQYKSIQNEQKWIDEIEEKITKLEKEFMELKHNSKDK